MFFNNPLNQKQMSPSASKPLKRSREEESNTKPSAPPFCLMDEDTLDAFKKAGIINDADILAFRLEKLALQNENQKDDTFTSNKRSK